MSEELEQLQKISEFFRRMKTQILLLSLLDKAKTEYDALNFKESRKTLIEAYRLDRKNPVVLRGLGCLKQFNKNYNCAIQYFEKALQYSNKKEVEYTLLGVAYYLQDKLDESVKYFNLAIDSNDNYTEAYEGRNQAMLENHLKVVDLQEALKKYF